MHSLKITDFFETNLLHNFYSKATKTCLQVIKTALVTPYQKTVKKTRKAFQILMYFMYTWKSLVKNYRIFRN